MRYDLAAISQRKDNINEFLERDPAILATRLDDPIFKTVGKIFTSLCEQDDIILDYFKCIQNEYHKRNIYNPKMLPIGMDKPFKQIQSHLAAWKAKELDTRNFDLFFEDYITAHNEACMNAIRDGNKPILIQMFNLMGLTLRIEMLVDENKQKSSLS